ncbi:type II TA system antitoxin MqsA family protein [Calditrichota bacterium GD2]
MYEFSFCPICGEDKSIEKINTNKSITIRNEKIDVQFETYHCKSCGEDFDTLDDTFQLIEKAREIYRKRHNIPSPEEIKKFMHEYGFSLRDMEKLSGIAFKTIDRYLKGAIPDPSNANLLKAMINYPQLLLELFEQNFSIQAKKYMMIRRKILDKINVSSTQNCTNCIFEKITSKMEWKSESYEIASEEYAFAEKWELKFISSKEKKWKKNITSSLVV